MNEPTLSIAGSDPSGGAGVQADLKVFHAHEVYGMAIPTLLTVQNTQSVSKVKVLEASLIAEQFQAILSDIPPKAFKTGALGNSEIIDVVAFYAEQVSGPLVVDPILLSSSGASLLDGDGVSVFRNTLFPKAYVVTPNTEEAKHLVEFDVHDIKTMERAAKAIVSMGAKNAIIKGGHIFGPYAIDIAFINGSIQQLRSEFISSRNTHGTGCAFSASLTARLARGESLVNAFNASKAFVVEAIKTAPGLGNGYGPLNLLNHLSKKK